MFTVADVVWVLSGPYAFQFDKRKPLGMIAPIWTSKRSAPTGWTSLQLDLSPSIQRQELVARLQDIHPSLLLFLRKLRCVDVKIDGKTTRLEMTTGNDGVTQLKRSEGTSGQVSNYILFAHTVPAYGHDEKRPNITQSEIVLAFPVTEGVDPVEREQEVHAFLPLRKYGFRVSQHRLARKAMTHCCSQFIIQLDLLTAANREDILTGREWNRVLRDGIATAVVQALMQLRTRPTLTYTWMRYVHNHVSDSFFVPVQHALISQLKKERVILSTGGVYRLPVDILRVPRSYEDARGRPLIPESYVQPKSYLAPQYDVTQDGHILEKLGVTEMSPAGFISGLSKMEADSTICTQADSWWESVCSVLRGMLYHNRHAISALKIIPLSNGSWVSSAGGDIYFDSAIADIPHDLGVMIVKPLELRSARRALFESLGVKEANYNAIATCIHSLHQYNAYALNAQTLVSHARFLYNHRFEITISYSLRVLSADNKVLAAKDAYMDHPAYSSLKLSHILRSPRALFLHPDYHTDATLPYFFSSLWYEWLRLTLKVQIVPKYDRNGLSAEFGAFLASASTQDKLGFLWVYGEAIRGLLDLPAAMKALRETTVVTSDGLSHALCNTYLKREALERFDDLPFLPVTDPRNAGWDFLLSLGVSSQVNGAFYLKELTRLAEREVDDTTLDTARGIYKQLDARFRDDGLQGDIR